MLDIVDASSLLYRLEMEGKMRVNKKYRQAKLNKKLSELKKTRIVWSDARRCTTSNQKHEFI